MNMKEAFKMGMAKKAQMGGLAGGVVLLGIAAVVAIIMVGVYNDVYNTQLKTGTLNSSTKTVFGNVTVFIGLLILLAAAGGFVIGRR